MRSGAKLLLLLSNRSPYLFHHTFTGNNPEIGQVSTTDTGAAITIAGGVATIAGATTSAEDPRIIGQTGAGGGFTRRAGLACLCSVKKDSILAGDEALVGWRSSVTGGAASLEHCYYSYRDDDNYYRGSGPLNAGTYPPNNLVVDTWDRVALILRDTGCHLLKWSSGATWERLWVDNAGASATLWPSIQQTTGLTAGVYDDLDVTLVTSWGSDAAVAQHSSPAAGVFAHAGNCFLDWIPGGVSRSIEFRRVDADNHEAVTIDGSGTISIVETIAGSPSTLGTPWAGSMTGAERVVIMAYDRTIWVYVNNTVRVPTTTAAVALENATEGELSDAATAFYAWRRTETMPPPFNAPGSSPVTRMFLESGDTVTYDGSSAQVSAWQATAGTSPVVTTVDDHLRACEGVPFADQNPKISATLSATPPYDWYLLVCRNTRAGGSMLSSNRGVYLEDAGRSAVFAWDTGAPTVNGIAVAGVSISADAWQRVRIHVEAGGRGFVQVEGVKSALIDLGTASIGGPVALLSRFLVGAGGIHGWVAYLRLMDGDSDAPTHAAIWAEMATRAAELSWWESELVTADTSHNGFPGYAILTGGAEIMAYRKGTAHATQDGVIVIRRRASSAASWGAEETVLSVVGYDLRDVGICQLASGRIVLIGDTTPDDGMYAEVEAWSIYSDDGGDTWSAQAFMGHPWAGAATGGAPVVIGTDIYCPVYAHAGEDPVDIGLCVSKDNGASWLVGDFIPVADGTASYDLQEPTLHVVDGEWCVIARGSDSVSRLWTSTDSGASWTAHGGVLAGLSPHQMVTLGDGRICALYRRAGATGFGDYVYSTSSDACRTWTDPVTIIPHQTTTEYGMPVRRSDGMVCVVASFTARVQDDPAVMGADIHYVERDETDL